MAFLAGVLLFVLATSETIVGQRKHTRTHTQPVGADVKTGLNFNCPEEFGYYPHPADCTQYYVCVFGGALLESCTGGLMYSHELQTCDWPRNVGCDGLGDGSTTPAVTYSSSSSSRTPETKVRYTHPPPPPPPPQPSAVVTSRGQPRQLHHNHQELIKQKQQQQLYEEAENPLPPAEEIESDRQQRVYRGQPSTVGQVQRDRDGLRHHTNAIPSSSGRGEKIGVISFGTQQQSLQYNRDLTNDIVPNSLTMTVNERFKRQTQSRSHRDDRRPWHIVNNPHVDLQRPSAFHFPWLTTNSFQPSHQLLTTRQLPYITTTAIPPTFPKARMHRTFDNPILSKIYDGNYQYFNFKSNTSLLSGWKSFFPNYHKSTYGNVANQNVTPNHSLNANSFVPSLHFILQSQRYKKPIYTEPTTYLRTPQLVPTTEVNLHFSYSNENSKAKGTSPYDSNFYTYTFTKEPKQSSDSPENYRNTKHGDYRGEFIKRPNVTSISTDFTTISLFPTTSIKPDDVQNKLKDMRMNVIPMVTKPVNLNKTQPNTTHEDDAYYYFYTDEDDSLSNETSSKDFPNKLYYDEYYDDKELNTTDYYYDDTTRPFNNSKDDMTGYTTSSFMQSATFPKIPLPTTYKPFVPQKTLGKVTIAPAIDSTSTSHSFPTVRPTENTRQRLIATYTDLSLQKNTNISRTEARTTRPTEHPRSTVAPKVVYNTSSYDSSRYDPYYALYDEDVDLYKDVEYTQHYNNEPPASQQTYNRGTPATAPHQVLVQEKTPIRGNAAYYSTPQDIYQPSVIQNYEDNHYNTQDDDRTSYSQTNKQTSRGDRNELNYVEESTTTKRITTTTSTTTTTPRHIPTLKSTRLAPRLPNSAEVNEVQVPPTHYTLPEGPGYFHVHVTPNHTEKPLEPITYSFYSLENSSTISQLKPVVNQPAPFTFPELLTTPKTSSFHYITKSSKSTSTVSTIPSSTHGNNKSKIDHDQKLPDNLNNKIITPTTYSPPTFFLKSLLSSKLVPVNDSLGTNANINEFTVTISPRVRKHHKVLKTFKLRLNPSSVSSTPWSSSNKTTPDSYLIQNSNENVSDNIASYEKSVSSTSQSSIENDDTSYKSLENESSSSEVSYESDSSDRESFEKNEPLLSSSTTTDIPQSYSDNPLLAFSDDDYPPEFSYDIDLTNSSWLQLLERIHQMNDDKISGINVSEEDTNEPVIPKPLMDIIQYETKLLSLEKPNSFESNPVDDMTKKVANSSRITSLPARVSRVNAAIKSVIALGGSQRQYSKCPNSQSPSVKCKKVIQRTNSRGRGTAHYSSGPGDAVVINRGTPPSRSRPTLKPSTAIVSKATEFIDIYKYPPHRPGPIYPQPTPDKTAAKCRKDVCLLPDCSCGGKEIPGDLPVSQLPQTVLLTFDDSVNDLNKGLYMDLFEKGRVNPNGCPIAATFYVSHEWTDYSQVQNLYSDGHEIASHTVSHSFGEQFSQKKWTKEVAGQREILSAYGGVRLEDVRGMRAPFLSVGGNKMFKMLYDSNFTYDSSMPIYENKPPSWPYTLDYKLFHDCMIPPCPTRSYPGVWEVPMVMWQDLNGGRCSMGDACSNPPDAEGVFKMLMKNFERHYTTNRAPFGLFYHAAWFTQPHHKNGFIQFLDTINSMKDVWLVTNWQAIQWVRDPTPVSRLNSFQPFACNYPERPKRCNNPKVCNLWHKTGVRYMRTCQPCPDIYPWTGNTGIRSSRIDNEVEE